MAWQAATLIRSRFWLVLAALFSVAGTSVARADDDQPARGFRKAVLIRFEGPITPLLEQFIYRKLNFAEDQGADLVIIEIDSPGGYLRTSENLADRFLNLDWAHTVAFVPREAFSGAAIAALGCDEIVMAPNAQLGTRDRSFRMNTLSSSTLKKRFAVRWRSVCALWLKKQAARPP